MKPVKLLRGATVGAMALLLAPLSSMAQRSYGIDVSSYQGSPNWSSVHSAGITFAYAKATEGTFDIDSSFTYNESNGKAAGVYMGAYHFCHCASDSPSSEASYFWNEAGGYINADGKSLMPMLDFEVFGGVVGASSYSAWANAWCNAVTSDASGKEVTVRPVMYTSSCLACNFSSAVNNTIPWLANYNGESSETGTPWSTCTSCEAWGTGVWDIWQFSSSASIAGISGAVDEDVFNGNTAAMTDRLLIGGQSGRIDVFGRGLDNALWHKHYDQANGGWSGWYSVGGSIASDPGSVSRASGIIDVFARVGDNAIWHITYGGGVWGSWGGLGGSLVGSPDACSQNQNNVDVFARGPDNAMWHDYWNGSAWSGWYSLGGSFNSDPGCVSRAHGCENVYARVGDNSLWQNQFYSSAWQGWGGFGGNCIGGPDASSQNANQVEVFVRGADSSLFHKWWNGSTWSGWSGLGGSMASDPGAVSRGNGIVDVFFQVGDGSCWHTYYWGGAWQGFYAFGGQFYGGMDAASWSNIHP